MDNVAEYPKATLESVWAAFREADRQREESSAKFDRYMAESSAKFDREMAESSARFDRYMAASSAKFDRDMAEFKQGLAASSARFDRDMAASRAEFDKRMKAQEEVDAKYKREREERDLRLERKMKSLNEMIGGVSNSNGMFAEDFFFNAIDMGDKRLFGEHFDQCYSLLKRYNKENQEKSEQDILLINGKAVAIVEVKYRARKEDIQKIVNRLPKFRTLYPEYKDHRVYLGLAAMSFDRGVEKESAKEGVAIVKQVGDMVVINDAHLKAY